MKKIEDYLVEQGLISSSRLNWAKVKQNETGIPLYRILIEEGIVSEEVYFKNLSSMFSKDFINLDMANLNRELIELFPAQLMEKYNFIPIERVLDTVKIATFEPFNIYMVQEIEELTGYKVEIFICNITDLLNIKKALGITIKEDLALKTLKKIDLESVAEKVKEGYGNDDVIEEVDLEDYDVESSDAPVVVLVNKLIYDAVKEGATDIHIECFEKKLNVRYRIDGSLKKVMVIEKNAQEAIISRLKIISDLDITERFIPQEGRFKMKVMDTQIDFRVTFLPSMFGQNLSIRIFNKKKTPLAFDDIGMSDYQKNICAEALKKKYGLILVVGPTGSGKTTTLYTMLGHINKEDIKVITIEDTVEYRMDGIHQIPVRVNREDPSKSLTFATGLKAILRQDPNVIMIGEIRDEETAKIAINAALTGHLVLSTIHANTSINVLSRLKHLGVSKELISDALELVVAQRLVRKTCKECQGDVEEKKSCHFCKSTGVNGRIGVFEVLQVDKTIKGKIADDVPGVHLYNYLREERDWKDLLQDATNKKNNGVIGQEEVDSLTI
ncbi:MAG: hypothetical protein C0601_08280 [Candidatus Muiribacterium halophilum]|uniref:AAA+ ATPase domain-containing protein n=1 Tax=Muiribacterium halophilum TaxID=2053465 RepID=A0A2N5ZEN6_MUIH1|nr:MAG: hypothetical protein C0601_08280 [Candidatus Muirbacterium halophilum]